MENLIGKRVEATSSDKVRVIDGKVVQTQGVITEINQETGRVRITWDIGTRTWMQPKGYKIL